MNHTEWLDKQRINSRDKWFVIGGNPDGDGGGVIATSNLLTEAEEIRIQAIKFNYSGVLIRTYDEFMGD